jgi:hypothetical protein
LVSTQFHSEVSRAAQAKKFGNVRWKNNFFRGDKPGNNGDNRRDLCRMMSASGCVAFVAFENRSGKSSVIASRLFIALIAATVGRMALQPSRAVAQWWSHAPVDFEECADTAEKAATKEAKASALAECNAKFAGRRKPGGGYTYFDFMQDRSFDIAGPNPTPDEQKRIDQQYTVYLDNQRRDSIAAAFAAKQQEQAQQQQPVQPATFRSETEKVPLPTAAPKKRETAADLRARAKAADCAQHAFSCEWPRLSEHLDDLKKLLFGSSTPSKPKRG